MSGDPKMLDIDRLSVEYRLVEGTRPAVVGASLSMGHGESVGIVGESGSGKSTLARSIAGLLPDQVGAIAGGSILVDGVDVTHHTEGMWQRLRGGVVGMVFQDPQTFLNPVVRVGDQISEAIAQHDRGIDRDKRVEELLRLTRLDERVRRAHPHELSGGMRQRALLAIALACRPSLLVADEPTTALDVTTQAEILSLIKEIQRSLGMALLLISHDLAVVATACDRIYVMYAGRVVESGPTEQILHAPRHPYTQGLVASALVARREDGRFATIPGEAPDMTAPLPPCPFAPRCPHVMDVCTEITPPEVTDGDRTTSCWLYEKGDPDGTDPLVAWAV